MDHAHGKDSDFVSNSVNPEIMPVEHVDDWFLVEEPDLEPVFICIPDDDSTVNFTNENECMPHETPWYIEDTFDASEEFESHSSLIDRYNYEVRRIKFSD